MGLEWKGLVVLGLVRQERRCADWNGRERIGNAGAGEVRQDWQREDSRGRVWLGPIRSGSARYGRSGEARHDVDW